MSEFGGSLLELPQKKAISKFGPLALVLTPLAAILFQVYVTRFLEFLAFLDLPLLVTVYFSIMQRSPIAGLCTGALIGMVQDSLSHQPIGILGLVMTLVGYFAASASQKIEINNPVVRFVMSLFFCFFHHFLYWSLVRALLGQNADFSFPREIVVALLNAIVSIPFFRMLDKLRLKG